MISTTSTNELTTLSRCRSHRRASLIMAAYNYNRRREMQDLLLLLLVLRRRQRRQNRRQLSYAGTPRSRPTRAASSSHSCIPCGRAHTASRAPGRLGLNSPTSCFWWPRYASLPASVVTGLAWQQQNKSADWSRGRLAGGIPQEYRSGSDPARYRSGVTQK